MFDSFQPVPSGRHPHIHKRNGIGSPNFVRGFHEGKCSAPLIRAIDLKWFMRIHREGLSKEHHTRFSQILWLTLMVEHSPEVIVDRQIIVYDQDSTIMMAVRNVHRYKSFDLVLRTVTLARRPAI